MIDLHRAHSFLFVPGHRPERFDKAMQSGAGAVILDLEDAVAAADKAAARRAIADWLSPARPVLLRINGFNDCGHEQDLAVANTPGVAGIIVSKAESPDQLAEVSLRCPGIPLLPLIESARGLAHCEAMAGHSGVAALVFGAIDFCLDVGVLDEDALDSVRLRLAIASRVGGLARPIDSVTTEFRDAAPVHAAAARARALGFGGKLCIHPAQVAVVNAAFRPSTELIEWARRVLAAEAASAGAATALDGQMLDLPVFEAARRLLADAGQ